MKKLIATCIATLMLGAFGVGCGKSECDKFTDCCDALKADDAFNDVTCAIPSDAADADCKTGRAGVAAAAALLTAIGGSTVPTECTEE